MSPIRPLDPSELMPSNIDSCPSASCRTVGLWSYSCRTKYYVRLFRADDQRGWREDRTCGRLCVLKRFGLHPCCECRPVLVSKPPLEKLRNLALCIELRGEPTIKRLAVVDSLLSCQSG